MIADISRQGMTTAGAPCLAHLAGTHQVLPLARVSLRAHSAGPTGVASPRPGAGLPRRARVSRRTLTAQTAAHQFSAWIPESEASAPLHGTSH